MAEERSLCHSARKAVGDNGIVYLPASSGDADGDCRARRRVARERSVDIVIKASPNAVSYCASDAYTSMAWLI